MRYNKHGMGNRINIQETIEKARKQTANEPNLSPALKATFDLLIGLCLLLAETRLVKNSSNSGIPPPADPNREKASKAEGKRKPGGQAGHAGTALKPVENPDKTVPLTIDRSRLPPGNGKRQAIERDIRRVAAEYRAEILENERGNGQAPSFPKKSRKAPSMGRA
jgi:transposase